MSDNIKVVVKVRPLIPREVEERLSCQWRVKTNTLYQLDQNGKETGQCFTFDKVYDKDTKTSDVYEDVAKPIIESATVGINGTIFAYGQTSSGKTYTMTGTEKAPGIIPLSVYNLFDKIKTIPDRDFLLRVSYIEIYNDKVIDLLDVENENIKVHETVEGVKLNASEKVITTPEELLDYMREGDANRQIGTTNMNEKSSRSHSIFQITIESREHAEDEAEAEIGCVNVSQLNLVDLAGSERAAQTGATGSRFKEGTFINKSLSVLGLVIKQLSEDNKFINYRDSKLTRILQNSLGGNAKTSIICAVTPAAMEETLSTLQFANRAKAIKNKPEVNAVATNATMIQRLTKQLAKLQYELENKRYLEQDNIVLTMKIDTLKRQILNSFNQRSQSDIQAKNRRRTWCAPRRTTVSSLQPIQEDLQDISCVQGFSTPAHKQFVVPMDTISFKSLTRSTQIDRVSGMSNISEESTLYSEKHDTRISEVIEIESDEDESALQPCSPYHKCYGTSKTPPCVLRDKAKKAEKMYQDIVDFTEREKVYPPTVVEYMQRVEQHQSAISSLEDKITTLSNECREKDDVVKLLEMKVTESEEQIKSLTWNKEKLGELCQDYNTKLTDLEVSYEKLQKKAKIREKELLSLLEEQKSGPLKYTGNLLEKEKYENNCNFSNTSKDILLNSMKGASNNSVKDDDGELQIQALITQLQDQLSRRCDEITKLQAEIEFKNQMISNLENSNEEVEEKIVNSNNKLIHLEAENSVLKSSIEASNATIENQKICIDNLHSNEKTYNDLFKSLQIELENNSQNNTQTEQLDDFKLELMFSNEKKLVENNDYIKNVIKKLKDLICLQKQEIKELKTKIDSVSTQYEDNNSAELLTLIDSKERQITNLNAELLKFKLETESNIMQINSLTQENSNLLSSNQSMLKQSSEIEYDCESLKREFANVVNQKNVELNNLIADLKKVTTNISELSHEKTATEKRNNELTLELQSLQSKVKDLESTHKNESQEESMCYVDIGKEIISKIQEILSLLNVTSFDDQFEISDVVETYKVFNKYINIMEPIIKDMKSQNIIIRNHNDELNTKISESNENSLILLDVAKDEIKELLRIISNKPFNGTSDATDSEGAVNVLKNYISMLKPLVMDMKSQNEVAIKSTREMNETYESEIQSLQSNLNLIQNEKIKMENCNGTLIKQYEDLKVALENTQSDLNIKDQANTKLISKMNILDEINADLQKNLDSCNNEITLLKSKELELKSHIVVLESAITKETVQCNRNGYLEQLEMKFKDVQENFTQKLKVIQQLLLVKDEKIAKMVQNWHVIKNSLENRCLESDKTIRTLQGVLADNEKTLFGITYKVKCFVDLLHLDYFLSFDIHEDAKKNKEIYSALPQFLDKIYCVTKTSMEEHSDCSSTKQKLRHLESSYDALLKDLDDVNTKYKLCLTQIEEVKSENKDLNNNLLQRSEELETQKIEIGNLYSNIEQLMDENKSLQKLNVNLQSKHLGCEDDFADLKNKINENTVLKDAIVLGKQTLSEIEKSVLKSPASRCPRTLISICCNRIKELLSSDDSNISERLSTSSSDLQINNRTLTASDRSCCTCSYNCNLLQQNNNQLKKEIDILKLAHKNLTFERDQYKEEIASILNLTAELHKKVVNHRTNLSTLTATTYAENKLLKSQVKVLQHHLKRFQSVCQRDFPSIKAHLSQLLNILQSDPKYFKSPIFCNVESDVQSISNENNSTQILTLVDTTIESDLMMLDTNTTLAGDNTLAVNNYVDLDLSQTLCHNDFENVFNESANTVKENNSTFNINLNELGSSYSNMQNSCTLTSYTLDNKCNCRCVIDRMQTLLNMKNVEFEELQVKLVQMEVERDELKSKLKLSTDPTSIEATNTMSNMQDFLHKTDEITKLENTLQRKNEQLKQLQEEVDSLSTEVMDNISEVDSLRKQLDTLQISNSDLNQKCLKLETLLAVKENLTREKEEVRICRECLIKDEIIQKQSSKQLHSEGNMSATVDREVNIDSERYNKIEEINKNLQNQLDASLEDCQRINEDVATIKNHLEKSNLSNASNINLENDDIFSITNNLRSPERRPLNKLTLAVSDIGDEITSIDLYVCERMECLNFYAEEMGVEKENLNHDIKIIDIMRMLHSSLVAKHGNEVENLYNKLRDFETSKCLLKEKFDQLSFAYDRITHELEEKNNRVKSLSDNILLLNKNVKEFQENLISSENYAELVAQFKDKILNIVDMELFTSSVNVFEILINNIANKQEKDLTNIMLKYTQLQDHMEKLVVEQNNLNQTLLHMKNQLAEKESKYNTLKMQKEKIHEINNAVTLDIIKKEQELNNIIAEGWRKLVDQNVIKAEDYCATPPLGKIIRILFDNCINIHKKYMTMQNNANYESEIENLTKEIENTKHLLDDKTREFESLKIHSDNILKINQSVSLELLTKEEQLRQLMLLHEEVSQKCHSQSIEMITNSRKVDDLNKDISTLKELLDRRDGTVKDLEIQIRACEMERQAAKQQELKLLAMLQEIHNLQQQCSELKTVNSAITKEKEYYSNELEKSRCTIKEQNEELSKISPQINNLKEILNEKIKEIEKLKDVGKIVLEENDSLRKECTVLKEKIKEVSQQIEEKEKDHKRLETNLKTHEKTAEIQNNIINKLQKQKEDCQSIINEKVKSLEEKTILIEQINERCAELQKRNELISQQLKESRKNRSSIDSCRDALESHLRILESGEVANAASEVENVRSGRSSLDAEVRRRRRSHHDARRAIENQNDEDDVFMAVLDPADQKLTEFDASVSQNSSIGGVTQPSSRGDSRHEKFTPTEKDDSNVRLGDAAGAARRRRQSVHDVRRSVRSSLTPKDALKLCHKEIKDVEQQLPEEIQRELCRLRDEVEMLRERCTELDEECDQCADAVRDRENDIVQLTKENEILETKLEEMCQKLNKAKSNFVEVAVNTDEDWSNLHAVVVDRMSYDAAVEKNRKLTRAHEESQRRVRELRAALAAARKDHAPISELNTVKNDFDKCRLKYEDLKAQHKALQAENAAIARRLHDLEDLLKKEDDKENRHIETVRHKRRTVHDQNRLHDHESKEEYLMEVQLIEESERQRRASTLTVATGSAIVQSQQMSDVMKENHKLRKLVHYLKKKAKQALDEEGEEMSVS